MARTAQQEYHEALVEFAADAARVGREAQHGDDISLAIVMMAGTMGRKSLTAAVRRLIAEGADIGVHRLVDMWRSACEEDREIIGRLDCDAIALEVLPEESDG